MITAPRRRLAGTHDLEHGPKELAVFARRRARLAAAGFRVGLDDQRRRRT